MEYAHRHPASLAAAVVGCWVVIEVARFKGGGVEVTLDNAGEPPAHPKPLS